MAFDLNLNGSLHHVDTDPQTPLLWVIRDHVGLTGTKFSCGIGQCGAGTVHVDGRAVRSCSVPASTAIGKPVMTIEGVSPDGSHPIQMAWKELDAPQCGYCQSGMIMSALALLNDRPRPTDAEIDARVTNACRCGTYHRVRQAIHRAAALMRASGRPEGLQLRTQEGRPEGLQLRTQESPQLRTQEGRPEGLQLRTQEGLQLRKQDAL